MPQANCGVLCLVRLRRFERPTDGLGIRCSILLSYRRIVIKNDIHHRVTEDTEINF